MEQKREGQKRLADIVDNECDLKKKCYEKRDSLSASGNSRGESNVRSAEKALNSDLVEEEKANVNEELTHEGAVDVFQTTLNELIKLDPLLCDLPAGVTVEEVNSQIALEYGQSMTVIVKKADGEIMPVVVEQKATVLDLKKAIQRYVSLKLKRQKCFVTLSWKYIWKTYWLYFDGVKLKEDHILLKDHGICNKAEVTFIKRLNERKNIIAKQD